MTIKITKILIEDKNRYNAKQAPDYKCEISASVMGGNFDIRDYEFSNEIIDQFIDGFMFQLKERINKEFEERYDK